MRVRYCNGVGDTLREEESNDISGVIAAVKAVDTIHFENEIFKYDNMLLNHYLNDKEEWVQELIIYLES